MSEKENEILLEVKGLVTEFGSDEDSLKAVNDISFVLRKGETVGIVGESGSGKSVTSLSIMRLIPNPPGRITAGEINYTNKKGVKTDLLSLSESEMRKFRGNSIGMIFQEPMTSLNPVYTCGEQVMEAILLHTKFPDISRSQVRIDQFIKLLVTISLITNPIRYLLGKAPWMTRRERKAKRITLELFQQTDLPRPAHIFYSYPAPVIGRTKTAGNDCYGH
jgi:ABC-type dipeptide/oligopeptide/nickel transport system ATPase component